jgi:ketosteroid isomerase-like protein
MMNRARLLPFCVFAVALAASSQTKSPAAMKKSVTVAAPDRAYAQKIWDGWATLDPKNVEQYYSSGPNTFFDIAPLKYGSWSEYEEGSKALITNYKRAKFSVNDDFAVHPHGDLAWATATVADEMTTRAGKIEMGNFRWTVIFENQDGKWMIVHEHVSAPIQ